MAAIDTPWMDHMSTPKSTPRNLDVDGSVSGSSQQHDGSASSSTVNLPPPPNYAPPTYAAFSPAQLSTTTSAAKRRSTILVHQKSPLLLATPPQITRALAYSHPFLLPLNKVAGLLSWTTGDPWESFLLLVAFWAIVLYGDVVLRLAGPIVTVLALIGGMYGRRYSPLSSSGWGEHPSNITGKRKGNNDSGAGGHQRAGSEATNTRHQKTLDEIVETLKVFTTRCNILLEPLLEMTDFLSTQRTATSATTRPALTTLFVRLMAITPIWVALTLPPWRIITTKRIALLFGTLILSWHSRPARVCRTLLWRSATVREIAEWLTGLEFEKPTKSAQNGTASLKKASSNAAKQSTSALTAALKRSRSNSKDSGVRFTFILYENQRRWVGLGWTSSLFAYERSAWTDEQNNPLPPRDQFELPDVEDAPAKWRWVEGSKWRVDGVQDLDETDYDTGAGKMGWIYYDNKWQNGRRGLDGWGRWTRRRKWYRDAELVEKTEEELNAEGELAPSLTPPTLPPRTASSSQVPTQKDTDTGSSSNAELSSSPEAERTKTRPTDDDAASTLSTSSKSAASRFRFPTPTLRRRATGGTQRSRRTSEASSIREYVDDDSSFGGLAPALELEIQGHQKDQVSWGIGDEAQMGLE